MIRRYRLAGEVTVKGRNFWGFPAELTFSPTPNGERGWFWRPRPDGGSIVPIDADCAISHIQQISLIHEDEKGFLLCLHKYEHIGVLRFGGVDGVVVSTRCSSLFPGWPPHFARAYEFWNAVKERLVSTDETIPWVTIPDTVYGTRSSGRAGYTKLEPAASEGQNLHLTLSVQCEYPEIGRGQIEYRLPPVEGVYDYTEEVALEGLMAVHTQGFPKMLFYLSLLASAFGWPHHERAVWPQKHDPVKTIELFLSHRMSDLLGALSLMSHTALPALNAVSYLSGHEPDLKAVKRARALIGPDPPDKA